MGSRSDSGTGGLPAKLFRTHRASARASLEYPPRQGRRRLCLLLAVAQSCVIARFVRHGADSGADLGAENMPICRTLGSLPGLERLSPRAIGSAKINGVIQRLPQRLLFRQCRIPRSSRRRPPEAPAHPRESPQGEGRKPCSRKGIPAYPRLPRPACHAGGRGVRVPSLPLP